MATIIQSKLNNVNNTLVELKQRIIFLIFSIIIFRVGFFIPIPGINHTVLSNFLKLQNGTVIDLFNMFSGGALSYASIFSLGIMPYISASIIMQLLTLTIKKLSNIKKSGEVGKKKINQYIRYITLLIAIFQSIGIALTLPNISSVAQMIEHPDLYFYFTTILSLCTGTILLMWLGELITECGIGNGISMIMFIGIVAKMPLSISSMIRNMKLIHMSLLYLCFIFLLLFVLIFCIVFIESSYRKIVLYHSKQRNLHKMYVMQHTHLPLKINMSGVIPAIFASSVIILLSVVISYFKVHVGFLFFSVLEYYIKPGTVCYILLYSILIFLFCFFYDNLVCNPREISENLKKSGVFIPGIRPGIQTTRYINNIINRLIFLNALYIIFVVLIPEFFKITMHIPFFIGGNSLLIIVVVVIDFIAQFQTFMISNKYNIFLKKSPLRMNR
ncbi:Preprotein translocase subunit SecY [Buchnera aphidicola (Takecallis arundicolens)]|uniref:preprotein translocase subunit SecY n=1 Tax=Buchnera aphidicola TaxID=9 RepID=UPI003464B29F